MGEHAQQPQQQDGENVHATTEGLQEPESYTHNGTTFFPDISSATLPADSQQQDDIFCARLSPQTLLKDSSQCQDQHLNPHAKSFQPGTTSAYREGRGSKLEIKPPSDLDEKVALANEAARKSTRAKMSSDSSEGEQAAGGTTTAGEGSVTTAQKDDMLLTVLPAGEPGLIRGSRFSEGLSLPYKSHNVPENLSQEALQAWIHGIGRCVPCFFKAKPAGCHFGDCCAYCHICGKKERDGWNGYLRKKAKLGSGFLILRVTAIIICEILKK